MPFYEYVCTECGAKLEILQKISDPPATECRACHAQALIKQVSAAGFRLKGGGWYETDFKSGDKRNLVNETGSDAGKSSDAGTPAPAPSEGKSADGGEKAPPAPAKPAEAKASETAKKPAETKAAEPAKKAPDAGKTVA